MPSDSHQEYPSSIPEKITPFAGDGSERLSVIQKIKFDKYVEAQIEQYLLDPSTYEVANRSGDDAKRLRTRLLLPALHAARIVANDFLEQQDILRLNDVFTEENFKAYFTYHIAREEQLANTKELIKRLLKQQQEASESRPTQPGTVRTVYDQANINRLHDSLSAQLLSLQSELQRMEAVLQCFETLHGIVFNNRPNLNIEFNNKSLRHIIDSLAKLGDLNVEIKDKEIAPKQQSSNNE